MGEGLVDMHLGKFEETGVELITGKGRFVELKTIQVDGERLLTAETIVINTGSHATIDTKIEGLAEAKPLTHIDMPANPDSPDYHWRRLCRS